jgi:U3 small nucleolar ribonucleoprotein protein IMP4
MMLLTSSRKPSFKTKILCKKLALFFDAPYMNRGKTSFSEVLEQAAGNVLLVVGDYHGNPGSLSFYDVNSNSFLSVYFSETIPDAVLQAELRYGLHEFNGTESSLVFKQLNRYLFGNTGRIIPHESLNTSKEARKNALNAQNKSAANAVVSSSSQSNTAASSSSQHSKTFVRRLNIFDDRLEFMSNDRIFLRLYIKSVKKDAAAA